MSNEIRKPPDAIRESTARDASPAVSDLPTCLEPPGQEPNAGGIVAGDAGGACDVEPFLLFDDAPASSPNCGEDGGDPSLLAEARLESADGEPGGWDPSCCDGSTWDPSLEAAGACGQADWGDDSFEGAWLTCSCRGRKIAMLDLAPALGRRSRPRERGTR